MKIEDAIEFDPEVLKQMNEKDLTLQSLYHQLLERPKLKHQLDAAVLQNTIVTKVQSVISQLEADPLTAPIGAIVREILNNYVKSGSE